MVVIEQSKLASDTKLISGSDDSHGEKVCTLKEVFRFSMPLLPVNAGAADTLKSTCYEECPSAADPSGLRENLNDPAHETRVPTPEETKARPNKRVI